MLHDVLMKRISLIKPFDPYGLKFKLIIETAKTAKTPKTYPVRTNGKDRKFRMDAFDQPAGQRAGHPENLFAFKETPADISLIFSMRSIESNLL